MGYGSQPWICLHRSDLPVVTEPHDRRGNREAGIAEALRDLGGVQIRALRVAELAQQRAQLETLRTGRGPFDIGAQCGGNLE